MQDKDLAERLFEELREYVSDENDRIVFNHMKAVTNFAKKRAEDNNLSKKIINFVIEASAVHDIGKFHSITDLFFTERPLGVFHGVIGGFFIKNYNNKLPHLLKNKESIAKIVACHIPFYIKKEELLDFIKEPLPYWDSEGIQSYEVGKIKLSISKLSYEEKIAAQILIATDNNIVENTYVGLEERLDYIFNRYKSRFSEEGKRIYAMRVKAIMKKYPMKNVQ